jgi:fructokinase
VITVYGGIELGGTNCNCAVGSSATAISATTRFDTGDAPEMTLWRALDWFGLQERRLNEPLRGVGVASFGPLDLVTGTITETPKPGWSNTPLRAELGRAFGCPVAVDTDVNCAALAEYVHGVGVGTEVFVYLTVGTGIGAGAVVAGELLRGRSHPEMGHMRIPQRPDDDFVGSCPFHGNCWEGLASGHALASRYQIPAADLVEAKAWELEAGYLALGVSNLICSLRPERIALGGGLFTHAGLRESVAKEVGALLAVSYFAEAADIGAVLLAPELGATSGLVGALLIAERLSDSP